MGEASIVIVGGDIGLVDTGEWKPPAAGRKAELPPLEEQYRSCFAGVKTRTDDEQKEVNIVGCKLRKNVDTCPIDGRPLLL